jgi:hypothetical protein
MVNFIEALGYVSIQNKLRLCLDGVYDLLQGVVATPARSESIAIWFKLCLSLWLYGYFYQSLQTSFASLPKCWDAKRSPFFGSRFGYPYPSDWLGLGSYLERRGKFSSVGWTYGFYSIYPSCFFPRVILSYPSSGQ